MRIGPTVGLLALLPPLGIAISLPRAADASARPIATALAKCSAMIPARSSQPGESFEIADHTPSITLASIATHSAKTRQAPSKPPKPRPARALRVSKQTVLRLADSGARPSARSTPAQGTRPQGLLLAGVSKLGVGLADGDILVQVAGRPVRTMDDVLGAVVSARSRHAPEISGRFWRNGELWDIVVEQPYLDQTQTERVR